MFANNAMSIFLSFVTVVSFCRRKRLTICFTENNAEVTGKPFDDSPFS